nr:HD domain-containing phosphohydrolase [Methylobacterium sp. BTF04]
MLISDDLLRAERLARDLDRFRTCRVHDLYDDTPPVCVAELIVSDVETLTSDAILRLRRILGVVRSQGAPYLFLVHGHAARAEAQAQMLSASGTLAAGSFTPLLIDTLHQMWEAARPVSAAAFRLAGEARQFLKETFFSGRPVTPVLAETGTELVAKAIQEVGIRDWVQVVQHFDDATHQHCLLVAGLAAAFSGELGLAAADRHRVTKAALLHDVGKIQIPLAILNKPAQLDAAEQAVMRTHASLGHAMLVGQGFQEEMLAVVRSHHEMLDGSGYPDGLKGAEIPDLVRLVTICDIYGALIERRPYRQPMPGEKAYGILVSMTGRLDDDLICAFHPVAAAFGQFPEGASA